MLKAITMILTHTIKKPVAFVFNFLCNTEKFVAAHPVIYKMNYCGNNQYRVFEKLKCGFISWRFTYTAIITTCYNNKVVMTATVLNSITIEMIFIIKERNDYSIVEEEINFKKVWPVKTIMQKIFKQQHTQLFKNIENCCA